jgi:membrane protease YdiL (CAAX protease family)
MPLAPYRTGHQFKLFLALLFVVWTLRATVGYEVDRLLPEGGARQFYGLVSKILLWIVPAVLYALAIRSDRPAQSLRLGWPVFAPHGWLPWSLGLGTLVIVAWYVVSRHEASFGLLGVNLVDHGLGVALWAFPVACVEEAFFRGLILTELTERLRFWVANLVSSLLFVAIHWPNWLWTREPATEILWDSLGVFLVGIIAGILTRSTRSVWPAVVWHTAFTTLVGVW